MNHVHTGRTSGMLRPMAFLCAAFFLIFLSRVSFSPMMPVIQADLGMTHGDAGELFFFLSLGLAASMLLSGFVSSRIGHKWTMVATMFGAAAALVGASQASGFADLLGWVLVFGLVVGAYLPSGVSTITAVVAPQHWGKALSLHEMAPTGAFVFAPLFVEWLIDVTGWRGFLLVAASAAAVHGVLFALKGPGGGTFGSAPRKDVVAELFRRKSFWCFCLFFSVAVGAAIGPYNMLPLYLTSDHGYSREAANTLLSISRVSSMAVALLAGWLTDRFGPQRTIAGHMLLCGAATIALGYTSGVSLTVAVLIQPVLSACYFPAAFTALSQLFEDRLRSVAISFIAPAGALVGAGLIPALHGHLGDMKMFSHGFLLIGVLLWVCLLLLPRAFSMDKSFP